MNTSASIPSKKVSVACGVVPCDTEEGRLFLQKRIGLFGMVGFLLCTAQYLFVNLLGSLAGGLPWRAFVTDLPNQIHLVGCGVLAAIFFLCRRGNRSHLQLAGIDMLGTLCFGTLLGISGSQVTEQSEFAHTGVLDITIALLIRTVIVPSSASRTFLIGLFAAIPAILGTYSVLGPSYDTFLHGLRTAAALIIATVASRVIYGLHCEVRERKQFGQYTLEDRIGTGGMGEVFRASHAMLRRPTAIKLLHPERAGKRNLLRFEREVQMTSRLTHPNTIAIYDYGRTPEGIFYYVMEYLDGVNLEKLVEADGPQRAARVIHILKQVSLSLIEAHGIGLIHRDIKPANIILCERGGLHDVVKLLDFGLVKDMETKAEDTISAANTITGTPHYLAPESIRSPDKVDALSDLYAVGAVGYFLLAGKHVFEGGNSMEVCGHHLHTPPVPPSFRLGSPVPKDLEDLILTCLEKDANRRPGSIKALYAALNHCSDAGKWSEEDAALWWESREMQRPGNEAAGPSLSGPTATVARTKTEAVPALDF